MSFHPDDHPRINSNIIISCNIFRHQVVSCFINIYTHDKADSSIAGLQSRVNICASSKKIKYPERGMVMKSI